MSGKIANSIVTFLYSLGEARSLLLYLNICLIILLTLSTFFRKTTRDKAASQNQNLSIPQVCWFRFSAPLLISGWWTVRKLGLEGPNLFNNLRESYGKIYKLPFGLLNTVVITDAAYVQKLLTSKDSLHLNKCKFIYKTFFMKEVYQSLFVSHTSIWHSHRKCLVRGFSHKALKSYFNIISTHSQMITTELKRSVQGVHNDTTMKILYDHVLQITGVLLTGEQWNNRSIGKIHERLQRHTHDLLCKMQNPHLFIPLMWKMYSKLISVDTEANHLKKLLAGVEGSKCHEHNKTFKPFFEIMRDTGWSKGEMLDHFGGFIIGEHEATCTALELTLLLLALHPEHQSYCRKEINQLFASKDSINMLNHNDLNSLKYLERCILESLRIAPPIPAIARKLYAPVVLSDTTTIDAGTSIIIPIWAIHHDAKYYPNPDIFDPNRFLPENMQTRKSGTFIPFSTGPRNCIGWKLAIMQMKIILTAILKTYEVASTNAGNPLKVKFALKSVLESGNDFVLQKISS